MHDRPADGDRVALDARPARRRGDARRPVDDVLHQRRRGGERERDSSRTVVHRPAQDHRPLSQLPRRDRGLAHAHRRPAPLAVRARHHRRRAHVRPVHVPLPGRPSRSVPGVHRRAAPGGDPPVRGRTHGRGRHPRDGHRDERDHRPPRRLPAVDPRGVRPARDPAHRRRGDGRLRPHREMVRGRPLGRRPRHPHDGEGDQLRLRPARRDVGARADRELAEGQVLRRRPDVQRASARVRGRGRVDRGVPRGGHRRARGGYGARVQGRARRPRGEASLRRRGPRARLLLGHRARRGRARRGIRSSRSTQPARMPHLSGGWPGQRSSAASTS